MAADSTANSVEVQVPDIGDFDAVEVIEVLVGAGQQVAAEDPLITLESDKATMEIPAPRAGTVTKLMVEVGQKVSQGTLILLLADDAAGGAAAQPAAEEKTPPAPPATTEAAAPAPAAARP
ncbi:MAG: dihydrolipoamide acetyltransferase, partial [Gammaproteobacteria bacterium]